jgi:hypothetical protein
MLELVLEYFIRPRSYRLLALSDKAYSPSTARFINRFHLFCEAVALALFVPLLVCIADKERCGDDVPLSLVSASLNAVLGTSPSSVAYGRLIMGLMFLRTFSLVRHWKQMWIGAVFEGYKKTAGPESGTPVLEVLVSLLTCCTFSLPTSYRQRCCVSSCSCVHTVQGSV